MTDRSTFGKRHALELLAIGVGGVSVWWSVDLATSGEFTTAAIAALCGILSATIAKMIHASIYRRRCRRREDTDVCSRCGRTTDTGSDKRYAKGTRCPRCGGS